MKKVLNRKELKTVTMILGIDPGGTTGLCLLNSDKPHRPVGTETKRITVPLLWIEQADVIVMESSVSYGAINSDKVDQIEKMGAIKAFAEMRKLTLHKVTPEERKRIKAVKMAADGDVIGKHAQDAYRVAMAYAIREGLVVRNADGTATDNKAG